MVNTLRRKMFSMGGNVPGYHGVGITSGMSYNKGGKVAPIGSDAYAKVMGPDGKMRESHNIGMTLLNVGLAGIPRAARYVKGLFTDPNVRKYGLTQADDIAKEIAKRKEKLVGYGSKRSDALTKGTMDDIMKGYKKLTPGRQAVEATKNFGLPALYGLGAASALGERFGVIDPERTNLEKYGTMISQGALDYVSTPALANLIAQGAFLDPNDPDAEIPTLSEMISGKANDSKTTDQDFGSQDNVQGVVDRISAEDQLRQDFETRKKLYEELMGSKEDENNLGVLGRSLLEASEALNQGKGFISAGNVFGTGISDEVARRAERDQTITDAATTQAITDVSGERSQMNAVIQEMIATGQASQIPVLEAVMSAQEAGIPIEEIPMDGNKEDVEAMAQRKNSVFMDSAKVMGGGIFVAVNSQGEIATFNNVQNAIAFAEDRS